VQVVNIGRYISSDPIGIEGGLNIFGYVAQNPVNAIDPLGLSSVVYIPGEGGTGRVVILNRWNQVVGVFPSANNVARSAPAGPWPPGYYPYEYAKQHANDFDPNGPYGLYGIFVFDAPQCNTGGCGIHAGRETKCDLAGRCGPEHATLGCIRSTSSATGLIQSLIQGGDPLTGLTVTRPMSTIPEWGISYAPPRMTPMPTPQR